MYYFRRRDDSSNLAGAVSEIAVARQGTQQVVTAVRDGGANLKLIAWRVEANGSVSRTGDSGSAAGTASHIDLAAADKLVAACRTGGGDLKLISWTLTGSGGIARAGDSGSAAGTASLIRIVALTGTLLVTACRTGSGTRKLIAWRLNANGSLSRLGDSGSAAGAVTEVALVRLSSSRVVTAVRAGNGTLKLIVWNVTSSGQVSRDGDSGSQAGEARLIRVVREASGVLVTSVRAANGTLKLIAWSVSADGNTVTRLGDSGAQAGQIADNALMTHRNRRERACSARGSWGRGQSRQLHRLRRAGEHLPRSPYISCHRTPALRSLRGDGGNCWGLTALRAVQRTEIQCPVDRGPVLSGWGTHTPPENRSRRRRPPDAFVAVGRACEALIVVPGAAAHHARLGALGPNPLRVLIFVQAPLPDIAREIQDPLRRGAVGVDPDGAGVV